MLNLFLLFSISYASGYQLLPVQSLRHIFYRAKPSSSAWDYTNEAAWQGTCKTGRAQSPINIDLEGIRHIPGKTEDIQLPPLEFYDYNVKGTINALNNGHTELFQGFTSWGKNQPSIAGGGLGARYILNQFHFHWSGRDSSGSEHTVDEAHYPLELHFVHIREDLNETTAGNIPGGMAVVAVFFQISRNDDALSELGTALVDTKETNHAENITWFTPEQLLPMDRSTFFRYNGSLTTPPCSEVVVWSILAKPNHVTERQLNTFRERLENEDTLLIHNFRDVQPLNRRKVYFVRTKRSKI